MWQKCEVIRFNNIASNIGTLTFIESGAERDVQFPIKRVYYVTGVPDCATRGSHAHKVLEQVIIAINGSFDIEIDDGSSKKTFHLSDPSVGLFVGAGLWRDITNYKNNAICLVLASQYYDEHEYIRDYKTFIEYIKSKN